MHRRIRHKVRGTGERPRLAVYRSLNHIYAQLIDDDKAQTLASASTCVGTNCIDQQCRRGQARSFSVVDRWHDHHAPGR